MRSLISVAVLFLAIQLSYGQATTATTTTQKTCKDFFTEQTCDALTKLVISLKETSDTVQNAINAGVKAHIQTTKDMLAFVKEFIASRIQCERLLSQDKCTVLEAVALQLKLTKLQLQVAIELAVNTTKATAGEIYNQTLDFLMNDINCENIFGKKACDNMLSALDKFHEQRSLLKEAILSVAVKHFRNTKMILDAVQQELVTRIKNFNCESILSKDTCAKLVDIATRLRILPGKVQEAIEMAVLKGITTSTAIYNAAITFLTEQITCDNILSPTACQNLLDAAKSLHEQRKLIQEAIMSAALKHITSAKEIYKNVRDVLIEKAVNFKCTDALPQFQCDLLTRVANRFHIRAKELHRIIAGAIIDGTRTAKALYDATIAALIEEAKDLECKDMIQNSNICAVLDAFASNIKESVKDVNDAIRGAIAQGLITTTDIIKFVKKILTDERSCLDLFKLRTICFGLRTAAWVKGVTFDRVIAKLRELYSNGITNIFILRQKIHDWLTADAAISKRSADFDFNKQKNEIVNLIMQVLGGITKVTEKVKANIKAELVRLANAGKLKLWNIKETIKNLLNKFNPLSDEFEDEVPEGLKDMSEYYKQARVMFKLAVQKIVDAAKKIGIKHAQFVKMVEDIYKSGIESINDVVLESL